MEKVKTPDGPMYVAGSLWALGALLIDCFTLGLITIIAIVFPGWMGFEIPEWVVLLYPGLVMIGYVVLTHLYAVRSLGRWALGLRKYCRSQVEGYVGKGNLLFRKGLLSRKDLLFVEDLAPGLRKGRLIKVGIVVGVLVMILIVFVPPLESLSQ